jgi:thiol-disulfide isomerase/thioredoxin
MVDWERVEQLRSKDWGWDEIADDPKVGFQADSGAGDPGRALRVLYHRRRARGKGKDLSAKSDKRTEEVRERKWNLLRVGYLVVPILAVWFVVAYVAPSPVGLILPAIPYILLALAVAAFVLIYALLRAEKRWTKVYRTTVITAVVLGLVFTGVIGLAGGLVFGCPYLPPASALSSQPGSGWNYGNMAAWQDGGKPVVYFYGASWCPFCSAGSWGIWKGLAEFGTVSGTSLGFSSLADAAGPGTPEIILANAQVTSSVITFKVNEDTSGVDGTFPGTSDCFEAAYVGAYSGGGIPFFVINGRAIHVGAFNSPQSLQAYTYSATGGTGAQTVFNQVQSENGTAWNAVNTQAWWIMAYIVKSSGASVATLSSQYHWSSTTTARVTNDLAQIS